MFDILIIGGGAAGFFTAINCADKRPELKIAILEKGKEVLAKVRISGGGRCNVTHAEFIPQNLVKNYPRGEKELLSPFHRFMCGDVMEWFENRGVPLKTEADGRVFPASDSSKSIIDCFLREIKQKNIELLTSQNVISFQKEANHWQVTTSDTTFHTKNLIVTTGSNPKIWNLLAKLGHTIVSPVPSLFTFNTSDDFIRNMAGISTIAEVSLYNTDNKPLKIKNIAPLLITHWGFSGPAVLKLSAWGARILAEHQYQCILSVNWLADYDKIPHQEDILQHLQEVKQQQPKKMLQNSQFFDLPKRLWLRLLGKSGLQPAMIWAELGKSHLLTLSEVLTKSQFRIDGKSIFKEEFVTAGGVSLSEINFKTFESKLLPNLYLAGEVIDVDAITGGFNFQNAWTGGYLISEALANK
ncbi:NAD(P)/FAD-dependent oxidoreductase [Capnocytophaga catalasegens]|nr:NAD(P)/FAD-dependent oxidoreductase [Capnocytophaga catalasegens]